MKNPKNIAEINFQYDINIDYDISREDCNCEDICRCGKIENARIESGNIVENVTNRLIERYHAKKDKILCYCLDRCVRFFKLYDHDFWDIGIERGYYGQEIQSVNLIPQRAQLLQDFLEGDDGLIDSENKIECILNLEYNFLIPEVENKIWRISTVKLEHVVAGSNGQMRKVISEDDVYANYDGPIGIVLQRDDGRYRLIDGYHRYNSAKARNKKRVEVVLGL